MSLVPILDIIGKIVERVIPDPNQRLQLQLELSKLADQEAARESQERLAQINVNNTEAANPNMFVAGWRPFVGWTCGVGAAITFVVLPIGNWAAAVIFKYTGLFPAVDIANLMALLGGMLGFGYLRSKDKVDGVADTVIQTKRSIEAKPKKKVLGVDWPF